MRISGYARGRKTVFLALRGLRTMGVRLARHQALRPGDRPLAGGSARSRPGPASRAADPSRPRTLETGFHRLVWPVLDHSEALPPKAVAAMLDGLVLFGMGYSWGGYESLIVPFDPSPDRTATKWSARGRPCGCISAWTTRPISRLISTHGFRRLAAARVIPPPKCTRRPYETVTLRTLLRCAIVVCGATILVRDGLLCSITRPKPCAFW